MSESSQIHQQLSSLLSRISEVTPPTDNQGSSDGDGYQLEASLKQKDTFRKVLHFFFKLASYIEKLRGQNNEEMITMEDDNMLREIELMQLPDIDTARTKWRNDWIDIYWTIINYSFNTGQPIGNVLRKVAGRQNGLRSSGYRNLTECNEITLNLAADFMRSERKVEKSVMKQMESVLEKSCIGQINETKPPGNWTFTEGSAALARIYSYLPVPTKLNKVIPGTTSPLKSYIQPIVQHLIGVPENEHQEPFEYGKLTLEDAALVRNELTKVLCHVPSIIEKFWNSCEPLPISMKFTFPPHDTINRIQTVTGCSQDQADGLVKQIIGTLKSYEKEGLNWKNVEKRGDLVGLNLLVQHGLLTLICLKAPSFRNLSRLTSIITSDKKITSSIAITLLDLISSKMYRYLNEATFKAKLNLVAQIISIRMAIEKTWDIHTYLLRASLYDFMEMDAPKIKHHHDWISKLQNSNIKKKKSLTSQDVEEITRKIEIVERDLEKRVGVLVVMMEIENKVCYLAKTFSGEEFELIDDDEDPAKLQGLDIKKHAPLLLQKILFVMNQSSKVKHQHCPVNITLGLVTTDSDTGGAMAIAVSKLRHKTNRVCTMPERILHFYDFSRKPSDKQVLLQAAWSAFMTHPGHLSTQIAKSLADDSISRHPILEWEFQLYNKNLPIQVISTLLHVTITNRRVSFQRCFSDPSHSTSIQFLLRCKTTRMNQIKTAIQIAKPLLLDEDTRNFMMKQMEKKEALKFLGLSQREIDLYSLYFYWEEHYPLDQSMEQRKLYFGMLMQEDDKSCLFQHLKNRTGKNERECELMFIKSLQGEQQEMKNHCLTYDPNIIDRVKNPRNFLMIRKKKDGTDEFVRFGTVVGTKTKFENVDWFSFHIHDVIRFSISHFHIHLYLRPFCLTFPNFFPEDLKRFATDKNAVNTPNIMIKSQLFVLLAMKTYLEFQLVSKDNRLLLRPFFLKNDNSVIMKLEPPSCHHHFDILTSLLNIAYLETAGPVRVAGREIELYNLHKKNEEPAKLALVAASEFEEGYGTIAGPDSKEGMEKYEFPDYNVVYQFSSEIRRIQLKLSRFYGGFPVHFEPGKNVVKAKEVLH